MGRINETPQYFVNMLKVEIRPKMISDLKTQLSSQPIKWIQTFIELEGVSLLIEVASDIESKPM